MSSSELLERRRAAFARACATDANGCWTRSGIRRDRWGYDASGFRRAFRLWHGYLPSYPYQIEHRCGHGDQGCVNPHHLEAVTASENTLRSYIRRRGQMHRRHLRVARLLHRDVMRGL